MHDCSKDSNRPRKYTPRALPSVAPFRQGVSLTAVSDQRLCLWIPPAFLKNCWTKKLSVQNP